MPGRSGEFIEDKLNNFIDIKLAGGLGNVSDLIDILNKYKNYKINTLDNLSIDLRYNSNFNERLRKLFSLTKLSLKISDIYEVKDGKIICDNKYEAREVIDKMNELDDWSIEVICNFTDASRMFKTKGYWNPGDFKDLSKLKIDTNKVTDMSYMFDTCCLITSIPQLDTSNVTNMTGMFFECHSLKSISQLDTSKVTNMSSMFKNCHKLVSISEMNTSKVTDMSQMFRNCNSLELIPQLDTSNVTNIESMFERCNLIQVIPKLNLNKVTKFDWLFDGCTSLEKLGYPIYGDQDKILKIISTTGIDGKPYKG